MRTMDDVLVRVDNDDGNICPKFDIHPDFNLKVMSFNKDVAHQPGMLPPDIVYYMIANFLDLNGLLKAAMVCTCKNSICRLTKCRYAKNGTCIPVTTNCGARLAETLSQRSGQNSSTLTISSCMSHEY